MIRWSLEEIHLPKAPGDFYAWPPKNFRVYVDDSTDTVHVQAEFATNMTSLEVQREFQEFLAAEHDDNSLEGFVATLDQLALSPEMRAGLEMGFVHFWAYLFMMQVPEILNIPGKSIAPTSYPLPLINPNLVGDYIREHDLTRFGALTLHLHPQISAVAYVQAVQTAYPHQIYIHAHQHWEDARDVQAFLGQIDLSRVAFIAQPLAAHNFAQMQKLLTDEKVAWFGEECLGQQDIGPGTAAIYQGVCLSLTRSGGYFPILRQIKSAQQLNLKIALDSGISTSLLAASAMHLANEVDFREYGGFLWPHEEKEGCLSEDHGQVFFSYLQ